MDTPPRFVRQWCQGLLLLACWLSYHAHAAPKIVASIKPLALIASAVADRVLEVVVLLPDGLSPHDGALRPSDIAKLHPEDYLLWVGPPLEQGMAKLLQKKRYQQRQWILSDLPELRDHLQSRRQPTALWEGCTCGHKSRGSHVVAAHQKLDWHLWLSPVIAQATARLLHKRLVQDFPEAQAQLDKNLQAFETLLHQTGETIKDRLAPFQTTPYLVFHDAYRYFECYFGLKGGQPLSIHPHIAISAKQWSDLRRRLDAAPGLTIFLEPQFRSRLLERLPEQHDVRLGWLDPLGMGVPMGRESYAQFLLELSAQFVKYLLPPSHEPR